MEEALKSGQNSYQLHAKGKVETAYDFMLQFDILRCTKFFEKKGSPPLTGFLVSVIKRISFKGQKARTESEGQNKNI